METEGAVDPLPGPQPEGGSCWLKHEAQEAKIASHHQHPYFHSKGGAQGGTFQRNQL